MLNDGQQEYDMSQGPAEFGPNEDTFATWEDRWEHPLDPDDIAEHSLGDVNPTGGQMRVIRAPWDDRSISRTRWLAMRSRAAQNRTLQSRRTARRLAVAHGPGRTRGHARRRTRQTTTHGRAAARAPEPDPDATSAVAAAHAKGGILVGLSGAEGGHA